MPLRPDLRSTGHVLRQSHSTFVSAAIPLLFAALLLLSFRSALLAGTLTLTSLSDRNPSLLSLLSSPPSSTPPPRRLPRRIPSPNPLLHVADDLFPPIPALPTNSTLPRLHLTSSSFFPPSPVHFALPAAAAAADIAANHLDRADAVAFLYLLTVLSLAHSLAIIGFIFVYSSALGIVFFSVATAHLGHPISLVDALVSGASLGIRRLSGFVFLKWSVRDALIQFLCICFFSEIADQAKLFKLFIKVKLMPFSHSGGGGGGGGLWDPELSGFLFAWMVLDTAASLLLSVHPWVLIMDHNVRRRGRDLAREGFYLVSLMPVQAFCIKCLETVLCGSLGRWAAVVAGERSIAGLLHSMAEVYFMVVWLVYYFAVRCKDAELDGRSFGRGDLEDCLSGLR